MISPLIDKGKVAYIDPTSNVLCKAEGCIIVGAEGQLVTPGFIDLNCP